MYCACKLNKQGDSVQPWHCYTWMAGTLLQAQAGTPSTQPNGHAERALSDGSDLFLYRIVGKMGSLRGLINSLTKDVLLATDWWVRVRGWRTSCPPLIGLLSFFVLKFCFLYSGGGFTQNGGAMFSLFGRGFHISQTYSFSYLEPVCCSMSSSNYCFLTWIQISQEAGQVVWYSHFFQNYPQFILIHNKGFGVVNKAEIDVSLELSCFFDDPVDVGNLIFGSSACSKTSLKIWKFTDIDTWLGEFWELLYYHVNFLKFCIEKEKEKENMSLAIYFLNLRTPSLPTCYPLSFT